MLCPYCRTENRPGSTRCAACTSWMVARQPVREWTRAREGLLLGGVCRGLATRWGLPVAALRLAFILGTLFAFWGVVVYIALWVVMPREPLLLPAAPLASPPAPATESGPGAGP
jgi:phage shock protein PspC (stress-responsive transcriptional regulator)